MFLVKVDSTSRRKNQAKQPGGKHLERHFRTAAYDDLFYVEPKCLSRSAVITIRRSVPAMTILASMVAMSSCSSRAVDPENIVQTISMPLFLAFALISLHASITTSCVV